MIKTSYLPKTGFSHERLYRLSFNSLMQLYAQNYQYLTKLFDIKNIGADFYLLASGKNPKIHITEITSYRYTTTFKMSYIFKAVGKLEKIPNARVKIYEDSKQAEILSIENLGEVKSFKSLTRFKKLDNIEARWELNNFLNRWLRLCLKFDYQAVEH